MASFRVKRYLITGPNGLDALTIDQCDEPTLGPYDVLVEMKAWSLNYRDLAMPHGGYVGNQKVKNDPPLVPLSDGAGEVIAIGDQVTRVQKGDRVCPIFFQRWIDGDLTAEQIASALGGAIDGVLSEKVALHEDGLVRFPSEFSFEQAATLPCAAVTAWQALTLGSGASEGLRPGQSVLLLGTGGVSIFALQLAKAAGVRVIITSSSDEKLSRAVQMGADHTINYREYPDWEKKVIELTDGQGVDNVIEVGGAGTLEKSLASVRVSGRVSLIGVLTGMPDQNPSPMSVLFKRLTMQGIYVGSRRMFEDLNQAVCANSIEPVIDRTFAFDEVRSAYEYLRSGKHLGKIVIVR